MIDINSEIDCCGCSACVQACSTQSIGMQQDKKGFLYPSVDKTTCIDCGLCEKVCPILNEKKERTPKHVYAVKNKDEDVRIKSSSGGVFTILAEQTLDDNGVVYGAAFDTDWSVHHVRITTKQDLEKLRGSKYVQSRIEKTYKEAKKDLNDGRKVLYAGTPCQIAGLLKYLRKSYLNLTTVDFVCHGVPSPSIWQDYLLEVRKSAQKITAENGYNSLFLNIVPLIEDVKFRDKANGWKKFRFVLSLSEVATGSSHSRILPFIDSDAWKDPYMYLFLKDYIVRPSCHNCHFRCGKSGSNFTLADFWEIEHFYPDFYDSNGVSMLLQNDESDASYIYKKCDFVETSYTEACYGNPAILYDWHAHELSNIFYHLHYSFGLSVNSCYIFFSIYDYLKRLQKKSYRFVKRNLLWQK